MNATDFLDLADFDGDTSKISSKSLKQFENLESIDDDSETVSLISNIPSMQPRIRNIVAVATFNVKFDLFAISMQIRNAEYKPKRFKAAILRIEEPKATALVFETGKINIVGCHRPEDSHRAAQKFGRMLKKLNYPNLQMTDFEIKTMIGTVKCPFKIRLDAIARDPGHKNFARYTPEIFAGVIYRLQSPKVTFLIFSTGSVVLTGAKNAEILTEACEWIFPVLQLFQMPATNTLTSGMI